jgi:hypothetical protein
VSSPSESVEGPGTQQCHDANSASSKTLQAWGGTKLSFRQGSLITRAAVAFWVWGGREHSATGTVDGGRDQREELSQEQSRRLLSVSVCKVINR